MAGQALNDKAGVSAVLPVPSELQVAKVVYLATITSMAHYMDMTKVSFAFSVDFRAVARLAVPW